MALDGLTIPYVSIGRTARTSKDLWQTTSGKFTYPYLEILLWELDR